MICSRAEEVPISATALPGNFEVEIEKTSQRLSHTLICSLKAALSDFAACSIQMLDQRGYRRFIARIGKCDSVRKAERGEIVEQ